MNEKTSAMDNLINLITDPDFLAVVAAVLYGVGMALGKRILRALGSKIVAPRTLDEHGAAQHIHSNRIIGELLLEIEDMRDENNELRSQMTEKEKQA